MLVARRSVLRGLLGEGKMPRPASLCQYLLSSLGRSLIIVPSIQQKLRDLGLEDKLARIPDWVFKNHRLVNRSNRLTTRGTYGALPRLSHSSHGCRSATGWARISAEMIRFVEWKAHKYPEVEVTMEVLRRCFALCFASG